jgi:crotonobetainyl-CoA:carnitine CoA-transferase CaiB-like acyl-CoA transferase
MPVSFSGMEPGVRRHAPMRGEHTDEILAESGYNGAQIADLRARKVVS